MNKNQELNQEIQEAIKKSLPSQVGEELNKLIEQGKRDAEEVKMLNTACENSRKIIDELNGKITEYQKFDERNSKLTEREQAVSESEIKLKIETLTYQLAAEKEKTEFSKNVALGLVRNTSYRKQIFDSENQQGYAGQNGIWVQPSPIAKSFSETTTKE